MVRMSENPKTIKWWTQFLKESLKETKPHGQFKERMWQCGICGELYRDENLKCEHEKLHIVERCDNCGTLLDFPMNDGMITKLNDIGYLTKFDDLWRDFVLKVQFSEMDVRGLGSACEASFCSYKCLKKWVNKQQKEKKEHKALIIP